MLPSLTPKVLALCSIVAFPLLCGAAGKFHVIHDFRVATDGGQPYGTLAFDSQGNLYGTTLKGGTNKERGSELPAT